jgi:type IV secretion system protein VirD4
MGDHGPCGQPGRAHPPSVRRPGAVPHHRPGAGAWGAAHPRQAARPAARFQYPKPTARPASPPIKETKPLARADSGLLIGRDRKSGKLLRYDGPAHLLTMAPTRTGKGVGTIIPTCSPPTAPSSASTPRARMPASPPAPAQVRPGPCPRSLRRHRPALGRLQSARPLDPAGLDVAEDAMHLGRRPGPMNPGHGRRGALERGSQGADCRPDPPYVVASEPRDRRNLATLRDYLTLAPEAFAALLKDMQAARQPAA